ncbi:hypothetical protein BH09SUM1_BH09SUM1_12700 [soil metagenome]
MGTVSLRNPAQQLLIIASLLLSGSEAVAQNDHITLEPLFVDIDGTHGARFGPGEFPGMMFDAYFETGLWGHRDYISGIDTDSGHDPGTIYVYRYQAIEMGGAALGYNHVGNGAFFHPTIPLRASDVPEWGWMSDDLIGTSGVVVESAPFIADEKIIPSLALSQEFSGILLGDYSCTMGVSYLSGSTLFPGTEYYVFPVGGVSFSMAGFWGPFSRNPSTREKKFSNISASGPMAVTFGADGYTTTTVTLNATTQHAYGYNNLLAATTGKNASQYLQEIGYEPSPPPVWVKKMALEEKLTGKTKWLYPPLTRHADANGDGVYDAADLAAAYAAEKKTEKIEE